MAGARIATLCASALLFAVTCAAATADERSIFHFPSADDVRMQEIARTAGEANWPFTVDSGFLICVWSGGQRQVMFAPETDSDRTRIVFVTNDPFLLTFGNMNATDLFVERADVARRMEMVAPYHALGLRLCDQPKGATLKAGEL